MKKTAPASGKKKTRILVVEDDPDVLEMLALVLEEAGFEVDQAEHAFGAVCAVVKRAPDLILTDIKMPIVDGQGLVRELKTHADTRDIPVVAVSGHDTPETRESALEAGCIGFIPKPIDVLRFPEQIAQMLRRGKASAGKG
jgi:two-component system cell cycle response regulator DivK